MRLSKDTLVAFLRFDGRWSEVDEDEFKFLLEDESTKRLLSPLLDVVIQRVGDSATCTFFLVGYSQSIAELVQHVTHLGSSASGDCLLFEFAAHIFVVVVVPERFTVLRYAKFWSGQRRAVSVYFPTNKSRTRHDELAGLFESYEGQYLNSVDEDEKKEAINKMERIGICSPESAYFVGRAYQYGIGRKVSVETALLWYMQSAELEYEEGAYACGILLERQSQVSQALFYFARSGVAGYLKLGSHLEKRKQADVALVAYRKACRGGNALAHYWRGRLALKLNLVPESFVAFSKAYRRGVMQAAKYVVLLLLNGVKYKFSARSLQAMREASPPHFVEEFIQEWFEDNDDEEFLRKLASIENDPGGLVQYLKCFINVIFVHAPNTIINSDVVEVAQFLRKNVMNMTHKKLLTSFLNDPTGKHGSEHDEDKNAPELCSSSTEPSSSSSDEVGLHTFDARATWIDLSGIVKPIHGSLETFSCLTRLTMSCCQLSEWPAMLNFHGSPLVELDLSANLIKQIPPLQYELGHLKRLELKGNQLRRMHGSFALMPVLEELDLRDNSLEKLSAVVLGLKNLKKLGLVGNPFLKLISGATQSDAAIPFVIPSMDRYDMKHTFVRDHYRALVEGGFRVDERRKVVVVGDKRLGRSTLMERWEKAVQPLSHRELFQLVVARAKASERLIRNWSASDFCRWVQHGNAGNFDGDVLDSSATSAAWKKANGAFFLDSDSPSFMDEVKKVFPSLGEEVIERLELVRKACVNVDEVKEEEYQKVLDKLPYVATKGARTTSISGVTCVEVSSTDESRGTGLGLVTFLNANALVVLKGTAPVKIVEEMERWCAWIVSQCGVGIRVRINVVHFASCSRSQEWKDFLGEKLRRRLVEICMPHKKSRVAVVEAGSVFALQDDAEDAHLTNLWRACTAETNISLCLVPRKYDDMFDAAAKQYTSMVVDWDEWTKRLGCAHDVARLVTKDLADLEMLYTVESVEGLKIILQPFDFRRLVWNHVADLAACSRAPAQGGRSVIGAKLLEGVNSEELLFMKAEGFIKKVSDIAYIAPFVIAKESLSQAVPHLQCGLRGDVKMPSPLRFSPGILGLIILHLDELGARFGFVLGRGSHRFFELIVNSTVQMTRSRVLFLLDNEAELQLLVESSSENYAVLGEWLMLPLLDLVVRLEGKRGIRATRQVSCVGEKCGGQDFTMVKWTPCRLCEGHWRRRSRGCAEDDSDQSCTSSRNHLLCRDCAGVAPAVKLNAWNRYLVEPVLTSASSTTIEDDEKGSVQSSSFSESPRFRSSGVAEELSADEAMDDVDSKEKYVEKRRGSKEKNVAERRGGVLEKKATGGNEVSLTTSGDGVAHERPLLVTVMNGSFGNAHLPKMFESSYEWGDVIAVDLDAAFERSSARKTAPRSVEGVVHSLLQQVEEKRSRLARALIVVSCFAELFDGILYLRRHHMGERGEAGRLLAFPFAIQLARFFRDAFFIFDVIVVESKVELRQLPVANLATTSLKSDPSTLSASDAGWIFPKYMWQKRMSKRVKKEREAARMAEEQAKAEAEKKLEHRTAQLKEIPLDALQVGIPGIFCASLSWTVVNGRIRSAFAAHCWTVFLEREKARMSKRQKVLRNRLDRGGETHSIGEDFLELKAQMLAIAIRNASRRMVFVRHFRASLKWSMARGKAAFLNSVSHPLVLHSSERSALELYQQDRIGKALALLLACQKCRRDIVDPFCLREDGNDLYVIVAPRKKASGSAKRLYRFRIGSRWTVMTLEDLWDSVDEELCKALVTFVMETSGEPKQKRRMITVLGHGSGGAVAQLFTLRLLSLLPRGRFDDQIQCIAFQPMWAFGSDVDFGAPEDVPRRECFFQVNVGGDAFPFVSGFGLAFADEGSFWHQACLDLLSMEAMERQSASADSSTSTSTLSVRKGAVEWFDRPSTVRANAGNAVQGLSFGFLLEASRSARLQSVDVSVRNIDHTFDWQKVRKRGRGKPRDVFQWDSALRKRYGVCAVGELLAEYGATKDGMQSMNGVFERGAPSIVAGPSFRASVLFLEKMKRVEVRMTGVRFRRLIKSAKIEQATAKIERDQGDDGFLLLSLDVSKQSLEARQKSNAKKAIEDICSRGEGTQINLAVSGRGIRTLQQTKPIEVRPSVRMSDQVSIFELVRVAAFTALLDVSTSCRRRGSADGTESEEEKSGQGELKIRVLLEKLEASMTVTPMERLTARMIAWLRIHGVKCTREIVDLYKKSKHYLVTGEEYLSRWLDEFGAALKGRGSEVADTYLALLEAARKESPGMAANVNCADIVDDLCGRAQNAHETFAGELPPMISMKTLFEGWAIVESRSGEHDVTPLDVCEAMEVAMHVMFLKIGRHVVVLKRELRSKSMMSSIFMTLGAVPRVEVFESQYVDVLFALYKCWVKAKAWDRELLSVTCAERVLSAANPTVVASVVSISENRTAREGLDHFFTVLQFVVELRKLMADELCLVVFRELSKFLNRKYIVGDESGWMSYAGGEYQVLTFKGRQGEQTRALKIRVLLLPTSILKEPSHLVNLAPSLRWFSVGYVFVVGARRYNSAEMREHFDTLKNFKKKVLVLLGGTLGLWNDIRDDYSDAAGKNSLTDAWLQCWKRLEAMKREFEQRNATAYAIGSLRHFGGLTVRGHVMDLAEVSLALHATFSDVFAAQGLACFVNDWCALFHIVDSA